MIKVINKTSAMVLKNWSEGFQRARKQASHLVYLFCRLEKFSVLMLT